MSGSGSLHSIMIGHGPDADTYNKMSDSKNEHTQSPVKMPEDAWAFMFESTYFLRLTPFASECPQDEDYYKCWQPLSREFNPNQR